MKPFVLIIEDDHPLSDLLRWALEGDGYRVGAAYDGAEGLSQAILVQPDLVVLDVELPGLDGWEVCRRLRDLSQVPVIVLTARGDVADKLTGFRLGADDYVTKPCSLDEFLARVRAVLKRSQVAVAAPADSSGQADPMLAFPGLVIYSRRHRVELSGKELKLTPKEFELLWFLACRSGTVVRREELLISVWGYGAGEDDRTIHTHINRLRSKLEEQGPFRYIHTVWGIGYKFDAVAPT